MPPTQEEKEDNSSWMAGPQRPFCKWCNGCADEVHDGSVGRRSSPTSSTPPALLCRLASSQPHNLLHRPYVCMRCAPPIAKCHGQCACLHLRIEACSRAPLVTRPALLGCRVSARPLRSRVCGVDGRRVGSHESGPGRRTRDGRDESASGAAPSWPTPTPTPPTHTLGTGTRSNLSLLSLSLSLPWARASQRLLRAMPTPTARAAAASPSTRVREAP